MARIDVVSNVLQRNEDAAERNRQLLSAAGVLAVNLISAPGSGKTSLLEQTLRRMQDRQCAVLVGDLQTSRDAERLAGAGVHAVQINTGEGCHLSADQVSAGLERLELQGLSIIFIENVGNMVCPVSFDLGEHRRVALLSVPEGDDKVAKYPTLFQAADVIVLNKVDLLGILDFDPGRVRADIAKLNTRAPLLCVSAKSGEGMAAWIDWLRGEHAALGI